jgi:hypothetical protein
MDLRIDRAIDNADMPHGNEFHLYEITGGADTTWPLADTILPETKRSVISANARIPKTCKDNLYNTLLWAGIYISPSIFRSI